jgi:hypothetical protein
MANIPVPHKNSYWVIPGKLLAGEYQWTKHREKSITRLKAMVSAGISRFIDLTTPEDSL